MGAKLSTRRWKRKQKLHYGDGPSMKGFRPKDPDPLDYDFFFNEQSEKSRGYYYDGDDEESYSVMEEEEEEEEEEEKCYDPLDSTLTFVDGEDEMDFLCNDYKSLRAKMSCGHTVTPMSLTDWCYVLLDQGSCTFVCGQTGCSGEWSFEEVSKMALLTPEEKMDFEEQIFKNASQQHLDVKACPSCNTRMVREDLRDLSVTCPVCTSDRKRPYVFCWQCLNRWKGRAPRSDRCDNADCQDPVEVLKTCPDVTFKAVEGVAGCPSIRACPTCGLLVEHNGEQCKTVGCKRCIIKFCFVCLKRPNECRKNPDGDQEPDIFQPYSLCPSGVAPRQTSIPVWERTYFF